MIVMEQTISDQLKAGVRTLSEPWELGGVEIPNRVVLAPLAGIGNWFVRLQAKRYGAGLAVSEMVSSFAVHYGNEKTCTELLRIHPDEHPVSVQLFGSDPDVMESAAERVAAAGADLIDINMGCPVPKVCKTGAGAALLQDPAEGGRDRAGGRAVAAGCRSPSSFGPESVPTTVPASPSPVRSLRRASSPVSRSIPGARFSATGGRPTTRSSPRSSRSFRCRC